MKTFISISLLLFASYSLHGQKAMTFSEAAQADISMEKLDNIYKSGIHVEPDLGVFNDSREAYTAAYQQLLQDLGRFLQKNDFSWKSRTKAFNRIYFDKSGKIDYFLFNFRPGQLSKEDEATFQELLNTFIAGYQFSLSASEGFAQCSPVSYMPSKKSE